MLQGFSQKLKSHDLKKEIVELLDIYHRLRSAAADALHFRINEPNIGMTVKKIKNHEAITVAIPAGTKALLFGKKYLFIILLKMQLLCGCRIAIRKAYPVDTNIIQGKRSHYMTTSSKGKVKI